MGFVEKRPGERHTLPRPAETQHSRPSPGRPTPTLRCWCRPPWAWSETSGGCVLTTGVTGLGSDAPRGAGADFEVTDPPEVRRHLRAVAVRLQKATGARAGAARR